MLIFQEAIMVTADRDTTLAAFESAGGDPACHADWLADPGAQAAWNAGDRLAPWYAKIPGRSRPMPKKKGKPWKPGDIALAAIAALAAVIWLIVAAMGK